MKRCLEPGCRTLTARTRCPAHGGDIRNNSRWRRLSRATRTAQPWCSACGSTTDLTADHIRRGHLEAGTQTLCRSCNSKKG